VIAEGTPDELKARTGAQTLTVRPVNPQDLSTLINIVGSLTLTQPEVRDTTVTAPVTDPDLAPAVVRRLDEAGVRLAELTLRGSTLDEVFLSLTGNRTGTPEPEPEEAMA
jgi:oleandomycin transport system ATP-binding protein